MIWIIIFPLVLLAICVINITIISLNQWNLFFQALYAFIYRHKNWKRYRRLKKYLKTNTIPLIGLRDYTGNNAGFAFVQYDDTIFVIQGDHLYLGSYYSHLIKDLLKHNNHDS